VGKKTKQGETMKEKKFTVTNKIDSPIDMRNLSVLIMRDIVYNSYQIYITLRDRETGKLYIAKSVEFEEVDECCITPASPLSLSKEAAQKLYSELRMEGVKPEDEDERVGELRATKRHLEDMRSIVIHKKIMPGSLQ
jgi:hypothetical protein